MNGGSDSAGGMRKQSRWEGILFRSPLRPVPPWKEYTVESGELSGPKVLVLSMMFPRPGFEGGNFVPEQVKALRKSGVDARVISGYRFWIVRSIDFGMALALLLLPFAGYQYFKTFRERQWMEIEGVPVMYVPYPLFWDYRNHANLFSRAICKAAKAVFSNFRFDLIHAHSSFPDGVAAKRLSAELRIPYLLTEHLGRVDKLAKEKESGAEISDVIKLASRIIAVSNAQKKKIEAIGGEDAADRIAVIPNGVDCSIFNYSPSKRPDPAKPRFLFSGYFTRVKRVEVILAAFNIVRQNLPGAFLTLVGSGPPSEPEYEASLRRIVTEFGLGESVRFLPRIKYSDRKRLAELIRNEVDIIVVASEYESFCLAIAEGMAMGKPAVSTPCGGPVDIIENASMGDLSENDSAESLAKAMLRAARNLSGYDPAKIAASAKDRFDYETVALKIKDIYGELIQG